MFGKKKFNVPQPEPEPEDPLAPLLSAISGLTVERVLLLILLWHAMRPVLSVLRRGGLAAVYKMIAGAVLSMLSKTVPGVAGAVASEQAKALAGLEKDLLGDGDKDALVNLPEVGMPSADVEARACALINAELHKAAGKRWGGIYHKSGTELSTLQGRVWTNFVDTNALYPAVFPSLRKFEAEIVAMTLSIVHGKEVGACGLLASGGTEAVLLAMLAYREQGRVRGIEAPEIICSLSAHPAVKKACHYFGIQLIVVGLEPSTMRLRAAAVSPFITRNTVAIYASAPSFSHGVVDPIEELGSLALSHGIGLHVDNCLGGYLLSFMQREGLFPAPFDFSVGGVTSMSVDVHKYGCAAKGVSVCCFRDTKLRQLTYVPSTEGCEGLYVTPTLQGSRSGATMAAAWATLVHIGCQGYAEKARATTACHRKIKEAVGKMPPLRLCADADATVVPICSDTVNVYALASLMDQRGWGIFTGQKPPTLTIPVGDQTPDYVDVLLKDLQESLTFLVANPSTKPTGNAAVYGSAASLPAEVLEGVLRGYVDLTLKVKPAAKP